MRNQKNNQSRSDRYKPRTHKIRNIFITILLVLLIAGSALGYLLYRNAKSTIDNVYSGTRLTKSRNVSKVIKQGKPFSVLLMGTDTGALNRNYKGRTDSMMVLIVNPKKEKTTLISIPRDAMIAIVGYEDTFPQKMNAAYAYGSAATAIKTVEAYLNIPIDFYAMANMGGLEKMVDQVGGVEIKSPLTFTYTPDEDESPATYKFTKGSASYEYASDGKNFTKHTVMDGSAALAFSRMRYDDPEGDYGRQKRQRLVLQALMKKAANVTNLLNEKFMNSVQKNIMTDLTFGDMSNIATKYIKAKNNVVTDHLQGTTTSYPDATTGASVSYEIVSTSEKQRITNKARKALGLEAKTTGSMFGGEVPSTLASIAESLQASSDGTSSSSSTDSSSDTTLPVDPSTSPAQ